MTSSVSVGVDFDQVIHDDKQHRVDGIYGEPIPGAFDAIREMQAAGFAVFVCTARTPVTCVAAWITSRSGIQCVTVADESTLPVGWGDTAVVLVCNRKLAAVAYIDDKAIRFKSWPQALDALAKLSAG